MTELQLIGRTSQRRYQHGTSPLGVRIPTRHRTSGSKTQRIRVRISDLGRRLRARNLNADTFLSDLLRVSGDAAEEASRMSLEISKSVSFCREDWIWSLVFRSQWRLKKNEK